MDRRNFVKTLFSLAALPIISSCTQSPNETSKPKGTTSGTDNSGVTFVSTNDMMAKNLKYVELAENADPKFRIKKGKTEAADQNCTNCNFYTAEADTYGKCTLLPKGKVKAQGWCMSWAQVIAKS